MSQLGSVQINETVIKKSVSVFVNETEGIGELKQTEVIHEKNGLILNLSVSVLYGNTILKSIENLQQKISEQLFALLGLPVLSVNVSVKGVDY